MSYNTYTSLLDGKVDIDVFLTMNVSMDFYGQNYEKKMQEYFAPFHFLKGQTWIFPVCDTLQVKAYSKYELKSFDEEHKFPPLFKTSCPAHYIKLYSISVFVISMVSVLIFSFSFSPRSISSSSFIPIMITLRLFSVVYPLL